MEKQTNEQHYPAGELEEAFNSFCSAFAGKTLCPVSDRMGAKRDGSTRSDCFEVWKGMEYVPAEGSAVLG